ncbi:MAG: ATP-dependent helicase [Planctomycetota bacterium]|jgi:DNA helicase-2/ATP-dependent DNA helicase PcrA
MQYEQLTPSQSEAVFHKEGPLLVLAGPGSGKTRVITYRVAALIDSGVGPHNICAITFTNKAADEMRQRVIALGTASGAHISTFHSLCVRILRRYAEEADINPNFSVYDESDQSRCIKQGIKDCELDTANFPPARMLEAISTLKNNLVDVGTFAAEADGFFSKNLAKIYACYQQILTERNAVDFDDLLLRTAFLLEGSADVCCELGNRFKFLLIDEYQDTNHAQYKIAKLLVSAHNNICATGDPDQSIYRWRGADIRNILAFEKDWPDAKVVKLEENFRSTPNILEAADKLISFNRKRKQKTLIPTRPQGTDIAINVFEDETKEAQAVAKQVKELVDRGASPNEMGVFYRINAMSRVLEEAFIQRKVRYQVVRGVEFYSRKEIRDLVAYLKVLVNPYDEIALLRIVNTPARGIGKTTIDRVRAYAGLCNIGFFEGLGGAEHIDSLSEGAKNKISAFVKMIEGFKEDIGGEIAPLAERVFVESGLEKYFREGEDQSALENVGELISAAGNYDEQAEERSLSDYLQQIALFSDVDAYDESKGCVAFMTLHCAKGLEFENVFIVGLEDGLLPHERSAADEEEMEEERRLFFVGMTRAKVGLNISCARYRTVRGQMLRTIPSPFLYELGIGFGETSGENEDDAGCEQHDANVDFAAGDRVQHDIFGLGTVQEFIDMGDNSVIVVKFNRGQIKSLMVKYAHLLKI